MLAVASELAQPPPLAMRSQLAGEALPPPKPCPGRRHRLCKFEQFHTVCLLGISCRRLGARKGGAAFRPVNGALYRWPRSSPARPSCRPTPSPTGRCNQAQHKQVSPRTCLHSRCRSVWAASPPPALRRACQAGGGSCTPLHRILSQGQPATWQGATPLAWAPTQAARLAWARP